MLLSTSGHGENSSSCSNVSFIPPVLPEAMAPSRASPPVPRPRMPLQIPSSLPRFSARRSAAFGANAFPSAARNRFDSVSDRVATVSAANVLSASRNTADRTNAASGSPASAVARSIRSRSLVDRRRSRRAVAVLERLQLKDCTVLYRTAGAAAEVLNMRPLFVFFCDSMSCGTQSSSAKLLSPHD